MSETAGARDASGIDSGDDTVFELRDVTVRFGTDRGNSRVLDEVSVDLKRNEIFGVVGESGSGKSMFASSLLDAVVEPGVLSGDITYYPPDGDPVDVLDLSKADRNRYRWEEVSMVFQGAMSSFNPVRRIETHFVETLSAHDYPVEDGMERARRLLSDLYLDPDRVLEAYPHELSGGMRQRILIALSLLLEPEVLVMDEPTAALDLLMQRSIISLIEEIKEEHDVTIVFITHDLSLVANLADRLGVLYAFEFVEVGPADEILRNAAHPYTRALLNSTPNLETQVDEMEPIVGSSPDPVNIPEGCSYHPRCPLADEECLQEDPPAYAVDREHDVHCHYRERVPESIPLSWKERDGDGEVAEVAETGRGATTDRRSDDAVVTLTDVEVHFEQERGSKLNPFSETSTVRAVDGVDLDVYENDVVVLVGESGSGKTTLGKAAIGVQEPTSGTVEYRGQDVWQARRRLGDIDIPFQDIRKALQVIHQDPGSSLNEMRRVKSTLEDPLKRWYPELSADKRHELIARMLDRVGMTPTEEYAERYPGQLSGGEKQRVALIRAMLVNPELILADEPVSALDVSLRVEMMDLMVELQDLFDTSFLFVSHDLSNARYVAKKMDGRIAIMYLGEIVEIGTPDEIIHDPKHPYTKALRWATTTLDPDERSDDDTPVRSIDIPEPTDPPRGCRYHTRCSEVIQPDAYAFEQAEWNAVMSLKEAVERGEFDGGALVDRVFGPGAEVETLPESEFTSRVRDYFGIPGTLGDESAERIVADALDMLSAGDSEGARALLEDEFPTVCQRRSPQELVATEGDGGPNSAAGGHAGDREVACFRHSEPDAERESVDAEAESASGTRSP
ncbi:ABC transporter ATP-binding protein [Halosimplex aquaticum]|uniref:ABC transporter ATP-binding protein n=1 Tax=Halosimplex aquaticum TaxID=3026162 RepID=A0ABD5Y6L5_9EURY|nr:ABC transporter ATP-binding protein [Halosimplex aquaticum]